MKLKQTLSHPILLEHHLLYYRLSYYFGLNNWSYKNCLGSELRFKMNFTGRIPHIKKLYPLSSTTWDIEESDSNCRSSDWLSHHQILISHFN